MTPPFRYTTAAQEVVFGPGELANLGTYLPAGDWYALLVTSGSYVRNGTVERVRAALGERLAAVFEGVQPHVPAPIVAAAHAVAAEAGVGMVIGLGGGSALGTAKATALALLQQPRRFVTFTPGWRGLAVPLIAIPTTYAGSEMTPIFGVTDPAHGKVTQRDERVLPALVVYDPDLTLDLPRDLTAGTGLNALAHCVEGAYTVARDPVSTATALAGIERIAAALPRLADNGHDRDARVEMLAGAYLGGVTLAHAGIAVHHGICHVLGGSAGLPHGVANAIMLPHAMRFNLAACAPQLAAVARALGVDTHGLSDEAAAEAAIERVGALAERVGLPRRLREAGVAADQLPGLAAVALRSPAVRANPRPITSAAEIEGILRAAW